MRAKHLVFARGQFNKESRGLVAAAPAGWLFWNLMAHPLPGEEDSTLPPRWL
jgi:hypothetical protein